MNRELSLGAIGQISVNAHDIPRAETFYREQLGLKHLFTVPGQMAFFDCDGIRLMLSIPSRPDLDHAGSIIYFRVSDIETIHRLLVERGVKFERDPMLIAPMETYDLWLAEFRDSENNVLALMCEKPKATAPPLPSVF